MHPKTKAYLKDKFKKLKSEGYQGKQLIAVALNMARRNGFDIKPQSAQKA